MLVFREVEVLARNQIETPESDVFTQEMSPQVFRSLEKAIVGQEK